MKLSVCLYEVFHKLHITEVDETAVTLVKRSNLLHLLLVESEIEDVEVLGHTLLVCTFRDSHNAALYEPAKCYLSGTLAILTANACQ